ncbi:topless-like protein [Medicago truncatula]|uniref:Topless-like protein n=1 Tax=Medicago truncatula TaxID=3880 RepID=A0A072VG73_MEDTR|nr:topless-like protein [Medicago truncatula]
MASLKKDLMLLVLQYLEEEGLKETLHKVEQESGLFFNLKYFEEKILAGDWDECEKYLNGFTNTNENEGSMKMLFEIRKQKYYEVLERENEELSRCGDARSSRIKLMAKLKKLIDNNPNINEKLKSPSLNSSRLQHLINQSLNWQYQHYRNPNQNSHINTLLTDNTCSPPRNGHCTPTLAVLPAEIAPFPPVPAAPSANAVAAWMRNGNPSSSSQSLAALAASSLPGPSQSVEEHCYIDNSLQAVKVAYTFTSQPAPRLFDELPTTIVCKLHQGSTVTNMEFHPSIHSILAVGSENGEISLWEARLRERLISKPFKIWNISNCSVEFQALNLKEPWISINRVSWSPDACFIGVAFAKHLIHLYTYQVHNGLQEHLEIDAHDGGVNDLAFSFKKNQLCVVTCGDDKLIKVWNLDGHKIFSFDGHVAPVYSVLPHSKENIQVKLFYHHLFTFYIQLRLTGKSGLGSMIRRTSIWEFDTTEKCCTTLLYNADGTRLFSCETSKDGECFLVEWKETQGTIKRKYSGFRNKSAGIVKIDAAKNRFLAAGVDNQIKFWDFGGINVLTSTDAGGGLPSLPCLRFNKEGNILAVTTTDGGFKVLANADGIKYLWGFEASKEPVDTKIGVIVDSVQCRIVTMPDSMGPTNKVIRLRYTNHGDGLLAFGSKGIQKLWKWSPNELNPTGKATTRFVPQHWTPNNDILMTNDVLKNCDSAIPCIDITNNDCHVVAAFGEEISLFNMVMWHFMSPTSAATFLALHPENNNILAVGKEDSLIHIFNVHKDQVLQGHRKYITGIVFSPQLNIMVSSGADAQLSFWCMDKWYKKKSVSIQMPRGGNAPAGETKIQFHNDQVKLLVCHESQIAIYDVSKMELILQWLPRNGLSDAISSVAYSCNGQIVYAAFTNGNIGVFDAVRLQLRCHIASSAYLNQTPSNSQNVYPLGFTAHPKEPNQFAIALSDGTVKVLEPTESAGSWGNMPPVK